MMNWIVDVKETEPGLMIEVPQEIVESLGWKEGDTLDWNVQPDGSCILTKVEHYSESDQEAFKIARDKLQEIKRLAHEVESGNFGASSDLMRATTDPIFFEVATIFLTKRENV